MLYRRLNDSTAPLANDGRNSKRERLSTTMSDKQRAYHLAAYEAREQAYGSYSADETMPDDFRGKTSTRALPSF